MLFMVLVFLLDERELPSFDFRSDSSMIDQRKVASASRFLDTERYLSSPPLTL